MRDFPIFCVTIIMAGVIGTMYFASTFGEGSIKRYRYFYANAESLPSACESVTLKKCINSVTCGLVY